MASSARPQLTYDQLNEQLKVPDTILIDVRGIEERASDGAIPGAKCIPIDEVEAAFKLNDEAFKGKYGFDKPKTGCNLIFHCKFGARAAKAEKMVSGLGYTNCRVYPGFVDWKEHGGTIQK